MIRGLLSINVPTMAVSERRHPKIAEVNPLLAETTMEGPQNLQTFRVQAVLPWAALMLE